MITGEHALPPREPSLETRPEETNAQEAFDTLYTALSSESQKYSTDRYVLPQYDNLAAIVAWLDAHRTEIIAAMLSPGATSSSLNPKQKFKYSEPIVNGDKYALYGSETADEINETAIDIISAHLLDAINLQQQADTDADSLPTDVLFGLTRSLHESITYYINITLVLLQHRETDFTVPR